MLGWLHFVPRGWGGVCVGEESLYRKKHKSTQIKIHGFPQRFPRRKKFWEEKEFLKYKSITKIRHKKTIKLLKTHFMMC